MYIKLACFVTLCMFLLRRCESSESKMESDTYEVQMNCSISEETNESETVPVHYTHWSSWSRCEDCTQRRTKKCISPKCNHSRVYEERPCDRRRCNRKRRRKMDDFHVVHVEESMQKSGSSSREKKSTKAWGKWSKWSKCTPQCRTYRVRLCKKTGKCRRKHQRQSAYCYQDNTKCELYVVSLLNLNNRRVSYQDFNKYHYSKNDNNSDNNSNNKQDHRFHQHSIVRPRQCGRPRKKSKMLKIIGGIEAKKYKWPWHVAVINRFREVFCAGSLIAPKWILTAGHCVRSYLKVRLNEHDLSAVDGRELEMTVQKVFLHPRFNHMTIDNDIALLRLPKPVKLPVVCLPSSAPESNQMCSIMGWGKLNSSDEYGSVKLHEAQIPIVEWGTCVRSYRRYLLTQNMLCAGWASGAADTCAGDSGGGLMCPPSVGSRSKGFTIQGITSFGDGCGRKNKYGIYTTVFNYLKWINYIVDTYS